MNRIVLSLLAGLCLCLSLGLPGCHSLGTIGSTEEPGLSRTAGLRSKLNWGRRPESNERVLSLARLMERHGRHDEAEKLYLRVLESDPQDRTACHRLGCLAVRRGEHEQGSEYFQRVAGAGEVSAALLNDMGYVLYLQHELNSAEGKLREALRKEPQFKSARNNLGLVLAEQGKSEEALAEFRLAGDEASAFSNLAFVQTKLGLLNEAEKNYHRALELDPKQRQAAEALVQFAQTSQKLEALAAEQSAGAEPLANHSKSDARQPEPQGEHLAGTVKKAASSDEIGLTGKATLALVHVLPRLASPLPTSAADQSIR